jgi:hypothetical protein
MGSHDFFSTSRLLGTIEAEIEKAGYGVSGLMYWEILGDRMVTV